MIGRYIEANMRMTEGCSLEQELSVIKEQVQPVMARLKENDLVVQRENEELAAGRGSDCRAQGPSRSHPSAPRWCGRGRHLAEVFSQANPQGGDREKEGTGREEADPGEVAGRYRWWGHCLEKDNMPNLGDVQRGCLGRWPFIVFRM